MEDIVIVSAARTAVGKFGGSLAKTPATELGAAVLKAILERSGLSADLVGEVIMGQVLAAGVGQNPARQSVVKAGLPHAIPGLTINAVCGSGLKAVMLAEQSIRSGGTLHGCYGQRAPQTKCRLLFPLTPPPKALNCNLNFVWRVQARTSWWWRVAWSQ